MKGWIEIKHEKRGEGEGERKKEIYRQPEMETHTQMGRGGAAGNRY